jgi:hypothetical protein
MNIKIRPEAPKCKLELNKTQSLDLLLFLTDFESHANTDESAEVVKEVKLQLRQFILSGNNG